MDLLVFGVGDFVHFVFPAVHNRFRINFLKVLVNSFFQFFLAFDANAFQHLPGHLAEKAFYQIQPGTMLGSKNKAESPRYRGQIRSRFNRCVNAQVVQNEADRVTLRVLFIEHLQKIDVIRTVVAFSYQRDRFSCLQIDAS